MGGAACSSTNAGVLRSKARIQKESLYCKKTGRRGKHRHRDTEREREREREMRESERAVIRHETVKKMQS